MTVPSTTLRTTPFRTKFDGDVGSMKGNMGIGCISDYEPQPLLFSSRIGSFALTFVGKINNYDELLQRMYRYDQGTIFRR